MEYALVRDGAILRRKSFDGGAPQLAANKGAWLPVVFANADSGPSQRISTETVVKADRVSIVQSAVDIDLQELKVAKTAEEAAKFNEVVAGGFPWNFGTADEPINETLQVHRDIDNINWIRLEAKCERAKAFLGDGKVTLTQVGLPKLRTKSNNSYDTTLDKTLEILAALEAWLIGQMSNDWRIKGDIEALPTSDEAAAYEIAREWRS